MGEELEERAELAARLAVVVSGFGGGYQDLDILGSANFLEELAAMAAGRGGNGHVIEAGLGLDREVGDEELLGVDGVVEGEARELQVDAKEDPTRRPVPDGSHVEFGDGNPGEALGGLD